MPGRDALADVLEVLDGVGPPRPGEGVTKQGQEWQHEDDQDDPDVDMAGETQEPSLAEPAARCRRRLTAREEDSAAQSTRAPRE